jgi:hypothetical protein
MASTDSKVNPYDLPVVPLIKDLDPKPISSLTETEEVRIKNFIVSIIKNLAPKYGLTEEKLLADIYEVVPPRRQEKTRPLTDEQVEEARKELVNSDYVKFKFPHQIRMSRDPAIPSQNFALITFYPSKEAKADNEGRFGSLKIRGVFSTETEAEDYAEKLIRTVDSFSTYFVAPCGAEVPIADDMFNYTKQLQEIDIRRKNDKIAKDYIQAKIEEEKKERQEVEERRETLMRESNLALEGKTATEPVDQYIEVRVSRASSRRQNDEVAKMKAFCDSNIRSTTAKLSDMEMSFNGPLEKIARERYVRTLIERGLNVEECLRYW